MKYLVDRVVEKYFRQKIFKRGKSWVANHIIRRYFNELLCTSKDGGRFFIHPKDVIQLSILTTGEWEPVESDILRKTLVPGMVFYDIGANFGYYTILAANLVGESGRVFAFEPNPSLQLQLQKNIDINHLSNVTILPFAVGDHDGEQVFYISKDTNTGCSSLRELDEYREKLVVKTITLDHYTPKNLLPKPDFIKMDIEGAEYLAIIGMQNMLGLMTELYLLIEISDYFLRSLRGSEELLLKKLKELGFAFQNEVSRHSRIMSDGKPLQYMLFLQKDKNETIYK